jgi:hypothetical protein
VSLVVADGGQERLDEAFARPPVDDEQEIDPRQFVDGIGPLDVETPSLPDGVKEESDSGDFGALAWFLTLSERIPPLQALRATDGWGGDAYVAYEQSGKTCIRIAWRGDTDDDRVEMRDALDAWTAAMPNDAASLREEGDVLTLDACDPGKDSSIEINGRSLDALRLIEMRSYLMLSAVDDGGLSIDSGFDFGECVIEHVPFDVVVQAATSEQDPPPTLIAAVQGCRP